MADTLERWPRRRSLPHVLRLFLALLALAGIDVVSWRLDRPVSPASDR